MYSFIVKILRLPKESHPISKPASQVGAAYVIEPLIR